MLAGYIARIAAATAVIRLPSLCVLLLAAMAVATAAPVSLGTPLEHALSSLDPSLASVIQSVADAVAEISVVLRDTDVSAAGSTNSFGDDQLQADIVADDLIFQHLRSCPHVETASSEEQSDILPMGGQGYTVAFDPLDGSSIFSANFAVGSIFGVWKGSSPLGQTGRDQVAAAYSIYGPRTLLVVAIPTAGAAGTCAAAQPGQQQPPQQQSQQQPQPPQAAGLQQQQPQPSQLFDVLEFALCSEGKRWKLRQVFSKLGNSKNIAPANIKAAKDNAVYEQLVLQWISNGCKLRYSGGMVPDIHHILAKGGGVFCNPRSPSAPAKLRLLYECAPLALIVEAAGGVSHNGQGSMLDLKIEDTGVRSVIAVGSAGAVAECVAALQAGQ